MLAVLQQPRLSSLECSQLSSTPEPSTTEASDLQFDKLREDLVFSLKDTKNTLDMRLQRQEQLILERLERLEDLLRPRLALAEAQRGDRPHHQQGHLVFAHDYHNGTLAGHALGAAQGHTVAAAQVHPAVAAQVQSVVAAQAQAQHVVVPQYGSDQHRGQGMPGFHTPIFGHPTNSNLSLGGYSSSASHPNNLLHSRSDLSHVGHGSSNSEEHGGEHHGDDKHPPYRFSTTMELEDEHTVNLDRKRKKTEKAVEVCKHYTDVHFPPLDDNHFLARAARSWAFFGTVAVAICANSLAIGLQTNFTTGRSFSDVLGRSHAEAAVRIPQWVSHFFTVFFLVECTWRMYVERTNFFFGFQWRWNVFDLLLCLSTIVEVVTETNGMDFMRMLRLLRMIHVLQVLRVLRVFDTLRHMIYAILNSMLSLVWIIFVLVLVLYIYGIYLLSVIGDHIQQHLAEGTEIEHMEKMEKLFGSLYRCMLSVFEGFTGGRNYSELLEILGSISWMNNMTFLLFWVFIVLGVMNIVTGIFVEKATELAKIDKEMTVLNQLDEINHLASELQGFFEKADLDGNGLMSWDEFQEQLQDSKVKAYFMTLGIDVQSACRVFSMLDRSGKGIVGVKDFVEGCIRVKGTAKSLDVKMLLMDVKRMQGMLEAFMSYTEDNLSLVHKILSPHLMPVPSVRERLIALKTRNHQKHLDGADLVGLGTAGLEQVPEIDETMPADYCEPEPDGLGFDISALMGVDSAGVVTVNI